ncbi:MAG TPA: hypothetical protein PL124_11360 [Candidatus Cloacimonadota bacterium]|nr:hypothetical protein [Candidatus Cloacimonadota bacterium]
MLKAKTLNVVIDACFSGSTAAGMLIKNASPVLLKVSRQGQLGGESILITSAQENEISSWLPEKSHSLFTYYYLKGMQGEADTNQDKKISAREMETWLNSTVGTTALRLYNRNQTPSVLGSESRILIEFH